MSGVATPSVPSVLLVLTDELGDRLAQELWGASAGACRAALRSSPVPAGVAVLAADGEVDDRRRGFAGSIEFAAKASVAGEPICCRFAPDPARPSRSPVDQLLDRFAPFFNAPALQVFCLVPATETRLKGYAYRLERLLRPRGDRTALIFPTHPYTMHCAGNHEHPAVPFSALPYRIDRGSNHTLATFLVSLLQVSPFGAMPAMMMPNDRLHNISHPAQDAPPVEAFMSLVDAFDRYHGQFIVMRITKYDHRKLPSYGEVVATADTSQDLAGAILRHQQTYRVRGGSYTVLKAVRGLSWLESDEDPDAIDAAIQRACETWVQQTQKLHSRPGDKRGRQPT